MRFNNPGVQWARSARPEGAALTSNLWTYEDFLVAHHGHSASEELDLFDDDNDKQLNLVSSLNFQSLFLVHLAKGSSIFKAGLPGWGSIFANNSVNTTAIRASWTGL